MKFRSVSRVIMERILKTLRHRVNLTTRIIQVDWMHVLPPSVHTRIPQNRSVSGQPDVGRVPQVTRAVRLASAGGWTCSMTGVSNSS